jgi:hypothetical protein
MNPIEQFFLDLNFSWFISRIAPFFIIQISACLVYVLSRKKVFLRNKIRSIVYALFILTAPIFFYFYSNPIYQGDLFDLGETPSTKVEFPKEKKLIVFTLPDCPYCHESVIFLKRLIKRSPKLEIEIWITGQENDPFYNLIRSKRVKIVQNEDFDNTVYLTKGIFPCFVISNEEKLVKRWTNKTFGMRALDEIEQFFEVQN